MMMFTTSSKYEQLILEKNNEIKNLKKEIESIQKNMQNMVSNVAHDLKSPLSAVSSGICVIKEAASDCKRGLNCGMPDINLVMEAIEVIEDTVKKMNSMNVFMFNSINHVLDCSRVQNGMKLTPKNETISITKNLELPISCMQEYQDKIKIKVVPWKSEICKYIITDPLWFQENLLCLLSNAAKYSSQGTVSISLSLKVNKTENSISQNASKENEIQASKSSMVSKTPIKSSFFFKLSTMFRSSCSLNKVGVESISTSNNEDRSESVVSHSVIENRELEGIVNITDKQDVSYISTVPANSLKSNISTESTIRFNQSGQNLKRQLSRKKSLETSKTNSTNLMLVVEVQDEGIGISEETMKELFSPFKQAQRLAGGTGLGLYSLSKRSEALGGQYGVRARSDGKQGSVFWFSIPYKPDQISARFSAHENKSKASTQSVPLSKSYMHFESESKASAQSVPLSKSCTTFASESKASAQPVSLPKSCTTFESEYVHNSECETNAQNMNNVNAPVNLDLSIINEEEEDDDDKVSKSITNNTSEHRMEYKPPPLNILLVEDSISILKLTGNLLRKQGHTVTEAINGEDALLKLEQVRNDDSKTMKRFDVLITDLQMPIMDGFEFMKRLRKKEGDILNRLCDTNNDCSKKSSSNTNVLTTSPSSSYQPELVFVCSSNSNEEIVNLAYDSGCDGVLEKPLKIQVFHNLYKEMKSPV